MFIKVLLILLIALNGLLLARYILYENPLLFWRNFFIVRNVFGYIYGILLLILAIPSIIIYYIGYWVIVAFTWIDVLGTKESLRSMRFSPKMEDNK